MTTHEIKNGQGEVLPNGWQVWVWENPSGGFSYEMRHRGGDQAGGNQKTKAMARKVAGIIADTTAPDPKPSTTPAWTIQVERDAVTRIGGGDDEGLVVVGLHLALERGHVVETPNVPQAPSSSPGEVEKLAGVIREMFGRAIEEHGVLADASDAVGDLCDLVVDYVRTALLSHISTAAQVEGAGELAALSKKATQGEWTTGGIFDPQGARPTMCMWGPRAGGDQSGQLLARSITVPDAGFVVALVNAYRSGHLVERPAADATNPQDQE